jgi:hypothetical protein
LAGGDLLSQHGFELTSKFDHEDFARKEARLLRLSPLGVGIESTCGHEYMEMNMLL